MVDQTHVAARLYRLGEQRLYKLHQVINLLELATRVLVNATVSGQDVQGLQQGDGLPRP